jgi:hypothetical protein
LKTVEKLYDEFRDTTLKAFSPWSRIAAPSPKAAARLANRSHQLRDPREASRI